MEYAAPLLSLTVMRSGSGCRAHAAMAHDDFFHDRAHFRIVNLCFAKLCQGHFAFQQGERENEGHTVRSGGNFFGLGAAHGAEVEVALDAGDLIGAETVALAQC